MDLLAVQSFCRTLCLTLDHVGVSIKALIVGVEEGIEADVPIIPSCWQQQPSTYFIPFSMQSGFLVLFRDDSFNSLIICLVVSRRRRKVRIVDRIHHTAAANGIHVGYVVRSRQR